MTNDEISHLARRVDVLEREVQALKSAPVREVTPPAPHLSPPLPAAQPPRPEPPAPPAIGRPTGDEVSLVGAWLARAGALAVLVGGAFAFKYAIDRGLIGPRGRVLIGLLVGAAFVAAGEWARRRDWHGWAQAVSGGAIGLWYLSIWSAHELYGVIGPVAALTCYAAVGVAGATLAVRHASEALAVLSVVGAFANPFLVGVLRPAGLLSYVLLVDVAVVGLATFRRWSNLERIALVATWLTAGYAIIGAPLPLSLAFAAAFFALFSWRVLSDRETGVDDPAFLATNSILFVGVVLAEVAVHAEEWLGATATLLGLGHLAAAWFVAVQRPLRPVLTVIGGGLLVLAVPLQFDGPIVPAVWALQGVAILAAKRGALGMVVGLTLLGVSVLDVLVLEFGLGFAYQPDRVLLSRESALMAYEIAAVAVAGRLIPRAGGGRASLVVIAHVLSLIWLTWEVQALFDAASWGSSQATAFTTTMVWAGYAGALLSAGVAMRSRTQRLLAVGIFGVVVGKLVLVDLWMLQPLYRTVAFIALGLTLLGCSLLYHRFRDLVAGENQR